MSKHICFSIVFTLIEAFCFSQNCQLEFDDSLLTKFNKSKILLTGEKHREPCNYPIQQQLFDYTYQNQDRKHLLIEYSYSFGFLIQEYIDSGDTNLLKELTFFGFGQDVLFDWIKDLGSNYNGKRMFVHGVDLENQPAIMLLCLHRLYSKHEIEDSRLTAFIEKDSISLIEAQQIAMLCFEDFDANRRTYWQILKEDFPAVDRIYRDYDKAMKYYDLRKHKLMAEAFEYREEALVHNIESTLQKFDSEAKYFGQFGHIHTTLSEVDSLKELSYWQSTAMRLNQKEIKTSSFGILHYETMDNNDLKLFKKEEIPANQQFDTPSIRKSKGEYFDLMIIY